MQVTHISSRVSPPDSPLEYFIRFQDLEVPGVMDSFSGTIFFFPITSNMVIRDVIKDTDTYEPMEIDDSTLYLIREALLFQGISKFYTAIQFLEEKKAERLKRKHEGMIYFLTGKESENYSMV